LHIWTIIIGAVLIWFYPTIVINYIILKIFWYNRKLIKNEKKFIKIILRESIGEIRFFIPIYNWFLLSNLLGGHHFIENFIQAKLKEVNKK
jgi:hypothetical protein